MGSLLILCMAIMVSAFAGVRSGAAQERIRVGLSSISATSGSIWVAEEKGLFKKHGVNVELIFIGGGAARVVSALLSGEIQFSVGGGDAVIRAALRGADTVLAFSPMNRGLQRLIVATRDTNAGRAQRQARGDHALRFRRPLGLPTIRQKMGYAPGRFSAHPTRGFTGDVCQLGKRRL